MLYVASQALNSLQLLSEVTCDQNLFTGQCGGSEDLRYMFELGRAYWTGIRLPERGGLVPMRIHSALSPRNRVKRRVFWLRNEYFAIFNFVVANRV